MNKIKVMLVDDQIILREGLKTIIELSNEMTVTIEAGDGVEAVELYDSEKVDVILMDIRMPRMNGIEATGRIKSISPDIVILVLTTFSEETLIVDALLNGADGYLLKDIDGKHLIAAIKDGYNHNLILPSKVARKLAERIAWRKSGSHIQAVSVDFSEITQREEEIGQLIGEGYTNKQIAEQLFLSEGTVKNYISEIYSKLGSNNRAKVGLMFTKRSD